MARPPRLTPDCSPIPSTPKFESPLPQRVIPKCDPPVETPEYNYDLPEPVVGSPPPRHYPDPYLYISPPVIKDCASWPGLESGEPVPEGEEVSVPAGEFETYLRIQDWVEDPEALYFIHDVVAADQTPSRSLIDSDSVVELARLFNISEDLAQLIITAARNIEAELVEKAEILAISRLVCLWWNTQQIAICDPEALPGDNNPVIIAAYTYSSTISQEDADAQAMTVAEAALICRWNNFFQIATCPEPLRPGDPDEAQDQILGQESPGFDPQLVHPSDPSRFRRNYVYVPGDTEAFSSLISQEDADAKALAWAETQLDCFYTNKTLIAYCEVESGDVPNIESPVEYDGLTTGNPVEIHFNWVASEVSWEDADDQALILAASSLNCVWENVPLIYSCDDLESDPSEPADVLAHEIGKALGEGERNYENVLALANKMPVPIYVGAYGMTVNFYAMPDRSSIYTVSVAQAEFSSPYSQEEANQLAATYALSQLVCSYCNPDIIPPCEDPNSLSYTRPIPGVPYAYYDEAGKIIRDQEGIPRYYQDPVHGAHSTSTSCPTVGSSGEADPYNLGADMGADALFCGPDPYQVAVTADLVGSIPVVNMISPGIVCEYGNEQIYAACQPDALLSAPSTWLKLDPLLGELVEMTALRFYLDPVTHKLALFEGDLDAIIHPEYHPSSTAFYVTIDAGSLTGATTEIANDLAKTLAEAQLNCLWKNVHKYSTCAGGTTGGVANGVFRVDVAADTLVSYESQDVVDQLAKVLADSGLFCIYTNEEKKSKPCVYPCTVMTAGKVSAGTVTSTVSAADANIIAELLADALANCLDLSTLEACIPADTADTEGSSSDTPSGGGGTGTSGGSEESSAEEPPDCPGCVPGGCSGSKCCEIVPAPEVDVTVFVDGKDACFDKVTGWRQYVVVKLDINVTQPDGCRNLCKGWGGRATVELGRPKIGTGWTARPEAKSFPLGLSGEGKASLFFKREANVLPCDTINIKVTIFETGPQFGNTSECGCVADSIDFDYTVDMPPYCEEDCGSSSSSSSSSVSSSSSSSSSSSDSSSSSSSHHSSDSDSSSKSAVVPASWTEDKYAALFCVEAPEVRFTDIMTVDIYEASVAFPIDPRFLEVCIPGSVVATGVCPNAPVRVGAAVEGRYIIVKTDPGNPPVQAVLSLSGVRKGFGGVRFPARTRNQFLANEAFLKLAEAAD